MEPFARAGVHARVRAAQQRGAEGERVEAGAPRVEGALRGALGAQGEWQGGAKEEERPAEFVVEALRVATAERTMRRERVMSGVGVHERRGSPKTLATGIRSVRTRVGGVADSAIRGRGCEQAVRSGDGSGWRARGGARWGWCASR